jgi:hypothetical protein
MNIAYKNRAWILMDDKNEEIARFKSRSQLMKYWEENGDGSKTQEKVDEKKDWLDDYEEEINDEEEDLDEEEEDS